MSVLLVNGLSISTPDLRLIEHVSFSLSPGQFLALVGPSGSGKSLTAQAIAGVLPRGLKSSGLISGQADVAYLPQDPIRSLDPLRTVRWHLAHANTGSSKLSKEDMKETLALVGLANPEEILNLYPHQLSGGMARRVTLAQSMLNSSPFLVIDEPTNGIDPGGIEDLMALFASIAQQNVGLLLITHDLPLALRWCTGGLVMDKGTIVECLESEPWNGGIFSSKVGVQMSEACRLFGAMP